MSDHRRNEYQAGSELVPKTEAHHSLDVHRIPLVVREMHIPIALVHGEPIHPAPHSGLSAPIGKTDHEGLTSDLRTCPT